MLRAIKGPRNAMLWKFQMTSRSTPAASETLQDLLQQGSP
jgi:hypothetical protein